MLCPEMTFDVRGMDRARRLQSEKEQAKGDTKRPRE